MMTETEFNEKSYAFPLMLLSATVAVGVLILLVRIVQ